VAARELVETIRVTRWRFDGKRETTINATDEKSRSVRFRSQFKNTPFDFGQFNSRATDLVVVVAAAAAFNRYSLPGSCLL